MHDNEIEQLQDASRYGETDKSLVTKQEAALFNSVEAQVARIIVEHLGCEAREVTREASFEALGADSLDHVELVMALEDEFGIEIADEDAAKADTVGKAMALVESKIG